MNILVVSNQFPSRMYPYKGTFIYNQVNIIKKTNHIKKIRVLAPNYAREAKYSYYQGIKKINFNPFTTPIEDPLMRKMFAGFSGKIRLLLFIFNQIVNIIQTVKKEHIQIIHAHWAFPSGLSAVIAKLFVNSKVVITSHGSDLTICRENFLFNLIITQVLKKTDYFITISNDMEEYVKKSYKNIKRIAMLYLGIPKYIQTYVEPIPNYQNNSKKHIIFVGSLYHIKGIQFLQKVIKKILENRNDVIFDIVSSGELMDDLKKFISGNNLNGAVNLHGFLTHQKTINLISHAYCAIQTSVSEGLSVFVQESIFFGLPIVATDVGGTREIVKNNENGFLVQYGDIEHFVSKILILLDDSEVFQKFSKKSLEIAQRNLDSEKTNEKLIKIYKRLLMMNLSSD